MIVVENESLFFKTTFTIEKSENVTALLTDGWR